MELYFDEDGRSRLVSGILKMARAVKSTLGALGKTVVIESPHHTRGLTVTKDGVTVARSITLSDPVENLAVRMLRDAADRTATSAGDGPQPMYAGVLTPNGWSTMGNMKVGMDICGTDGSIQKVVGVYNKGLKEIFEITFADGRKVECSGDHLWTVTTSYGSKSTKATKDMAKDFCDAHNGHKTYRYYVPVTGVDFHKVNGLPIKPYLMGLLLGDGSLSGTGSVELSIGEGKAHILDVIDYIIPDGMYTSVKYSDKKNYYRIKINGTDKDGNSMKDLLDDLNLLGVKSGTKFIPHSYLYNDKHSREELLRGLLDTDGYINNRGLFEYSTISDRLADDFCELIRGLGMQVSRRVKVRNGSSYSNTPIHAIEQRKGRKYGSKIVNIEATGKFTEMRCIKVSNDDHLYITDDYVVTHNTTTSIVIAEAMILKGVELLKDGLNMSEVARLVEGYVDDVIKNIGKISKKVTGRRLIDVATISANNDTSIGKNIANVYKEIGRDGVVTVETSQSSETYFEVTNGIKIDRGYASRLFINNHKNDECILDDVYILATDLEINSILEIENILKPIIHNKKKLLIIGHCSQNVTNTLGANVIKNGIKVCTITPPQFGYKTKELMSDIAIAVGAKYFSEATGDDLSIISIEDLGHAEKVVVGASKTVIVRSDEVTQDVTDRIEQLKESRALLSSASEIKFIDERIASLSGGVGVIYVGGDSDIEQKEKYDRYEDAVCAVRSAIEEGILPGGGLALAHLSTQIGDDTIGDDEKEAAIAIIKAGMESPMRQILDNAGLCDCEVYDGVDTKQGTYGYNVKTKQYGDMYKMGIIDPAKVTKSALKNASSVAMTILTTNAIVANESNR